MKQIRRGVFETNSSSTHSLTVCTEDEYNKWKRGELLYDCYEECFIEAIGLSDFEKDQAKEYYNVLKKTYWKDWKQLSEEETKLWYIKYAKEKLHKNGNAQTYDEYSHNYDLEHYEKHYTSPSGDKIVIFGQYGYDG